MECRIFNENFTINRYFCVNSKYKFFFFWEIKSVKIISCLFNTEENKTFSYFSLMYIIKSNFEIKSEIIAL